jgi:chromosome segregation ATPase
MSRSNSSRGGMSNNSNNSNTSANSFVYASARAKEIERCEEKLTFYNSKIEEKEKEVKQLNKEIENLEDESHTLSQQQDQTHYSATLLRRAESRREDKRQLREDLDGVIKLRAICISQLENLQKSGA